MKRSHIITLLMAVMAICICTGYMGAVAIQGGGNVLVIDGSGAAYTSMRGESGRVPQIDAVTSTLQSVMYEHHEIHEGDHFYLCGQEVEGSSGTVEFIVVTPDTAKWAHMTFSASGSGDMTFDMYEGPTTIAGGTGATPINNNRNSATTSTLTVTKDPASIGADGTLIYSYRGGANTRGAAFERHNEIILKQNTAYLIRITSNAAANNISYCGEWYEHTSVE